MILITGSTGYIGSHLSNYFEKNKIEFVGIDNLSYSYKENVPSTQRHFFIDISNKKQLKKIFLKYTPATVIHCAAFSYVLEAEKYKKKYLLNNVVKTKKFITICKEFNVKNFIFLSSSNVYKENIANSVFNENMSTVPKNTYGKSKLLIEKYLKKKKFDNLIILRLFNVIGMYNKKFKIFKFKNKNYQRLIFKILQNYSLNKTTYINFIKKRKKNYFPSRDFININDLSKIIKKLIRKILIIKKLNQTINVGSGKMTPINQVINILQKKNENKLKINYIKLTNKELLNTKASIIKLKKLINYTPKINITKSINSHYE